MPRQIFGFTEPETPTDGVVSYITAHLTDRGDIVVSTRARDGRIVSLELPRNVARQLGAELIATTSEN